MRLLADETLFRSIEAFDPDYVPEQFAHRDAQLSALASCIKPALRGGRPLNALLTGPSATGKTTSVKIALQQLEEITKKAVPVYVNCSLMPSAFRVFAEIHKRVVGYLPPETGAPLTKIYDTVFEKLQKEKKILLVALDDISFPADVLYSILRAYEMYDVRTGVFAVMQRSELHRLDDKTRSIFNPQEIRFLPYSTAQISDILRGRAAAGFYPNVVSDKLLEKMAVATSEKNDLRFGIELMKRAALEAESDAARIITETHFAKVMDKLQPPKEVALSGSEKELLAILGSSTMKSGQLFEIFSERTKASYSTFYRLLERLEKMGTIRTTDVEKGGRTRMISRS